MCHGKCFITIKATAAFLRPRMGERKLKFRPWGERVSEVELDEMAFYVISSDAGFSFTKGRVFFAVKVLLKND